MPLGRSKGIHLEAAVDGLLTLAIRDTRTRFACEWDGCEAAFLRKADVTRHVASTHDIKRIDCDVSDCSRKGVKGFARTDHRRAHMRDRHAMDIPKRGRFPNNKRNQQRE